MLHDEWSAECRDERISVHVQPVGTKRGSAVLVCELVAGVSDLRLDCATRQSPLADDLEVFPTLTDIDGDSDDLARKLDYWIEHPEERKALGARYAALGDEYRVGKSVRKMIEVYKSLKPGRIQ